MAITIVSPGQAPGGSAPDADSSTKGLVKLAGDLTGTADSPQIAAGAVGTPELAAGAVTAAKVASDVATQAELAAAADAAQPLNSGLTAIAALSTTAFGRSLLTVADAAAGRSTLGVSAPGVVFRVDSAGNLGATHTSTIGAETWLKTIGTLNANHVETVAGITAEKYVLLRLSQDSTGGRTFALSDGVNTPQPVLVNAAPNAKTDILIVGVSGTEFDVIVLGPGAQPPWAIADTTGLQAALDSKQTSAAVTKRVVSPISGAPTGMTSSIRSWAQGMFHVLPFTPSRMGVQVMNSTPTSAASARNPGAISIDGFWIGKPVFPSGGLWVGDKATSTQVVAPFSTPSNGDDTGIIWFTNGSPLPAAFEPFALTWGGSVPSALSMAWSQGATGSVFYFSSDGTDAHSQASGTSFTGAGFNFNGYGALDVRLVVEFVDPTGSSIPIVLALGDSITAAHTNDDQVGVGASGIGLMPHQTWVGSAALRNRFAFINAGMGGAATGAFSDTSNRLLSRFGFGSGTTVPDLGVSATGYNDAGSLNMSVAAHKTNTKADLDAVSALGVKRLALATAVPGQLDGTADPLRQQYNGWRTIKPYGVEACYEFSKAIENPADHTKPDTDYTPSGQIHPGVRGQAKIGDTVSIRAKG